MDILGFYYEQNLNKLHANGRPISRELKNEGYVQKDNREGVPRWYVKPNKVWLIVRNDGVRKNYDITLNILAIYPERQRVTLKLAQETVAKILTGEITFAIVNNKPYLLLNEKGKKKKQ